MLELEKRMQEEPFDVEVQACDPDDCRHTFYGKFRNQNSENDI